MSRVTKDLGDVVISITNGKLHGIEVVHERQQSAGTGRSLWYVEGMAMLRMSGEQRRKARACTSTDGERFSEQLKELSEELRAQEKRPHPTTQRPRNARGHLLPNSATR
jgi:predicted RNA-binding protein YlxR (DUF448 family)